MNRAWICLVAVCLSWGVLADEADSGKAAYASCGACHLPNGEGVQGAFPPLKNRLLSMAQNPTGREYLVRVILDGLTGPIVVDGVTYNGFMQPHRQTMNDEKIRDVLNFILFDLSDTDPTAAERYTLEEVAQIRKLETVKAAGNHKLRESIQSP